MDHGGPRPPPPRGQRLADRAPDAARPPLLEGGPRVGVGGRRSRMAGTDLPPGDLTSTLSGQNHVHGGLRHGPGQVPHGRAGVHAPPGEL